MRTQSVEKSLLEIFCFSSVNRFWWGNKNAIWRAENSFFAKPTNANGMVNTTLFLTV
jgi:hypothetical protein